eukprot:2268252-Amphidinium_carterae.1
MQSPAGERAVICGVTPKNMVLHTFTPNIIPKAALRNNSENILCPKLFPAAAWLTSQLRQQRKWQLLDKLRSLVNEVLLAL